MLLHLRGAASGGNSKPLRHEAAEPQIGFVLNVRQDERREGGAWVKNSHGQCSVFLPAGKMIAARSDHV